MKKLLITIATVFCISLLSSCKDPFFDGKFQVVFDVINKTETTLFLEYEDAEKGTLMLKQIEPEGEESITLGVYEGNKNEDMPPTSYYNEKIQRVTIYRNLENNARQTLPKTCYDRPELCHTYVNAEFVMYEAIYQFTVKEVFFGTR